MQVSLRPTDQIPPAALHGAFEQSFADYVAGPFTLSLAQWPAHLARHGVDLSLGRAAVDASGTVQAFALVAPRAHLGRWRLGAMGALPQARGTGVAQKLLEDLAARAQAAGLSALELECIAQNERALALYRRHGFEARHALLGFVRPAGLGPTLTEPAPEPQPHAEALTWLADAETRLPDMPLQMGPTSLAHLGSDWTAWQRGSALLAFSEMPDGSWLLRALVDRDPAQRDAEALVRSFCALHGDRMAKVHPLQRMDLGGDALQRCGFERGPLSQWLMVCPLTGQSPA